MGGDCSKPNQSDIDSNAVQQGFYTQAYKAAKRSHQDKFFIGKGDARAQMGIGAHIYQDYKKADCILQTLITKRSG